MLRGSASFNSVKQTDAGDPDALGTQTLSVMESEFSVTTPGPWCLGARQPP